MNLVSIRLINSVIWRFSGQWNAKLGENVVSPIALTNERGGPGNARVFTKHTKPCGADRTKSKSKSYRGVYQHNTGWQRLETQWGKVKQYRVAFVDWGKSKSCESIPCPHWNKLFQTTGSFNWYKGEDFFVYWKYLRETRVISVPFFLRVIYNVIYTLMRVDTRDSTGAKILTSLINWQHAQLCLRQWISKIDINFLSGWWWGEALDGMSSWHCQQD